MKQSEKISWIHYLDSLQASIDSFSILSHAVSIKNVTEICL